MTGDAQDPSRPLPTSVLVAFDSGCGYESAAASAVGRLVPSRARIRVASVLGSDPAWGVLAYQGGFLIADLRKDLEAEANLDLVRMVSTLPSQCSIEHYVADGWRQIAGEARAGRFDSIIIVGRPAKWRDGWTLRRLMRNEPRITLVGP